MVDKKKIQETFSFKFKIGCKSTSNINNAFDLETTNGCTVQRLFKKFCKGDENLENEESSGCLWKLTMTNWEQLSKPILLQLHKKLPKNSMSTNL